MEGLEHHSEVLMMRQINSMCIFESFVVGVGGRGLVLRWGTSKETGEQRLRAMMSIEGIQGKRCRGLGYQLDEE